MWGSHLTLGAMFDGSCDGISGQPELKQGAVSLRPVTYAYEGQMVGAILLYSLSYVRHSTIGQNHINDR